MALTLPPALTTYRVMFRRTNEREPTIWNDYLDYNDAKAVVSQLKQVDDIQDSWIDAVTYKVSYGEPSVTAGRVDQGEM